MYFGNDFPYLNGSYNDSNMEKSDNDDFLFMKLKDKNELNYIIKNLSLDTINDDAINNKYMMSMINKAVNSYKNYLKVNN